MPARQASQPDRIYYPTNSDKGRIFRGPCGHCQVMVIAMSQVAENLPTRQQPRVGDAIHCQACLRYSVVRGVDDHQMRLEGIHVPGVLDS